MRRSLLLRAGDWFFGDHGWAWWTAAAAFAVVFLGPGLSVFLGWWTLGRPPLAPPPEPRLTFFVEGGQADPVCHDPSFPTGQWHLSIEKLTRSDQLDWLKGKDWQTVDGREGEFEVSAAPRVVLQIDAAGSLRGVIVGERSEGICAISAVPLERDQPYFLRLEVREGQNPEDRVKLSFRLAKDGKIGVVKGGLVK